MKVDELRRLLVVNGLAGYWRGQTRAQMYERVGAVERGEAIPAEWKAKEHLKRDYSPPVPPGGEVFADMTTVELNALMKFRGLNYQPVPRMEKIQRLLTVEVSVGDGGVLGRADWLGCHCVNS